MNDRYNVHLHIFTGKCAPKDFLQVGLNWGDGMSTALKWLFLTKPVSWIITQAAGAIPKKKLQFLKIGVMATQAEVFKEILEAYRKSHYTDMRFVALTIDMDYMTDSKNKPSQDFNSQVLEVYKLKKVYANELFPFYGIDPRNPDTLRFVNLKVLLQNKVFAGIKLYPPNGFFPFDPRLDALYAYAEANNVPIMTHCTRGGSYYVGKNIWSIIPDYPLSLDQNHPVMQKVYARIKAYKTTLLGEFKTNGRICNVFTHPENYLPVLNKYPKLRLCIAHMGGDVEILGAGHFDSKLAKQHNDCTKLEAGTCSWYETIKNEILVAKYPNTFTDISYSICDAASMKIVNKDIAAGNIDPKRILFGTDYFMVAQEDEELKVVAVGEKELAAHFPDMMGKNIQQYLY